MLRLRAIDLNVKSLNAIEAELQARKAGALAFAALELEQELFGVAPEQAQLIEIGIVAGRNNAAVAQEVRR